mgnify:CR=1 FL=1
MLKTTKILFLMGFIFVITNLAWAVDAIKTSPTDIRLYTLNCGTINVHDVYGLDDTEFYQHQSLTFADPCYLIKHDSQWMLWDLGLGDKYLEDKYLRQIIDNKTYGVKLNVSTSLVNQLKQVGLTPRDIKYIAISHAHFDHVGNINLFPHATLLIQDDEYNSIQQSPLPSGVNPALLKYIRNMHKILIKGNFNVFGDNSVILLHTPGHTPGHQSLQIKLPTSGIVILSGDLYNTRAAFKNKLVPVGNVNRADTLASMDRINGILKNTKRRLIIQHDIDDFNSMPKFPNYLN